MAGIGDIQLGIASSSGALPVKIVIFNGARRGVHVDLRWQTAAESNNKGFFIERNFGGSFSEIGWQSSKAPLGNAATPLNYQFIDSNNAESISYYRLKQIDLNGVASYSTIVLVRGNSEGARVYPNPTTGILYVNLPLPGIYSLTVADPSGRIVKKATLSSSGNVNLEGLSKGIYTITVQNAAMEPVIVTKITLLQN